MTIDIHAEAARLRGLRMADLKAEYERVWSSTEAHVRGVGGR